MTFPALTEALKADHGFNVDSSAIRDLINVMASYDDPARRAFLQFITGSPKLPIGGTFSDHHHILASANDGSRFPWLEPTTDSGSQASRSTAQSG